MSAAPEIQPSIESNEPRTPRPARGPGLGIGPFAAICLLLGVLGAAGLTAWGAHLAASGEDWSTFALGATALIIAVSLAGVAFAASRASGGSGLSDLGDRLEEQLTPALMDVTRCLMELQHIRENTLISERAKRVAYRDEDREAVRRAIEEDLARADYASARLLVDEFERAFGYKAEAERFRDQIRRRADDARGQEIENATSRIDHLCFAEHWTEAFHESDRLIERYGGDSKVRLLKTRIEEKRQQRKLELVKQFHDAHQGGDLERASDLVHQLDQYLTPDEGAQLREDAREVFKSRLLSLKARYSEAMHTRDFGEALRIGTMIRRDFPNSQLAKEVAKHEPRLREAAGVAPEEDSADI